jgi:WD40 repeat protein/predicted Ser/Thr protein kinase
MTANVGTVKSSLAVDSICDRFESLCRGSDLPNLESFLGDLDEAARRAAFFELLALDVEYRQDRGESVSADEYLDRFPEFAEQVRGFFAEQAQLDTQTAQQTKPTVTERPSLAGTRIGPYDVLSEISRGGMGVVYQARQAGLDRLVAVKVIVAGPLATPAYIARFQAEARMSARLQHPSIVSIYEVGESNGLHYFSMEFVNGKTLAQLVKQGPLPGSAAARYVRDAAYAMQYAHEQGVLHRDMKPSNVMVDSSGRIKVMDFGLAKQIESAAQLTHDGELLGTPSYMSPEQAAGQWSRVDCRSDVYSLGAVLYELITGKTPHLGDSAVATMLQVVSERPAAPRDVNPEVDTQLEAIVLKCLEKNPAARYATAAELADDLDRYLTGQSTVAASGDAAPPWYRQRKYLAGLGGAAAALALGVILIIRGSDGRIKQELKLKTGDKLEVIEDRHTPTAPTDPVVRKFEEHEPINPAALVREPATLPGVQSWTLELPVHRSAISALAIDATGEHLVSASTDGALRFWSHGGEKLEHIEVLASPVRSTAFSPSGKLVATAANGRLTVWNVATHRREWELAIKQPADVPLAWSPNERHLVCVIDKLGLQVIDVQDRKAADLISYKGVLRVVAFSPNSEQVAIGMKDGSVEVISIDSGRRRDQFDAHKEPVVALDWLDDETLITGSAAQTVRTWKLGPATRKAEYKIGIIASLHTVADSKNLLVVLPDGAAELRNLNTGEVVRAFKRPALPMEQGQAVISSDGSHYSVGFPSGTVATVEPESGDLALQRGEALKYPDSTWNTPMPPLAWAPKHNTLAFGSPHGFVAPALWNLETGEAKYGTGITHVMIVSAAWSDDGELLATGGSDPIVRIWDRNGKYLRELPTGGWVTSVAFAPKSHNLAAAVQSGHVSIWNGDDGMRIADHDIKASFAFLGWSPDAAQIAAASYNGTLNIFDAKTGEVKHARTTNHDGNAIGEMRACDWSSDGKWIAFGGRNTLFLLNTATQKIEKAFGVQGGMHQIRFSPEGDRVAYSDGPQLIIRRVDDGEVVAEASPCVSAVRGIAWSPDGKRVAVATANYHDPVRILAGGSAEVQELLFPLATQGGIVATMSGEVRGDPGILEQLIAVVQTANGQENLSATEFAKRYGWKGLASREEKK